MEMGPGSASDPARRATRLRVMVVAVGPENALDHVVVLMFENRSFDNLLGRLYEPGEVASFEGVLGKELSNPIPEWAEDGAERGSVPYGVATSMNTPSLDPGEEYPHINTQLFNVLGRPGAKGFSAPYNAPAPGAVPTIGFVGENGERLLMVASTAS
ncbi:hypothetical protein ACFWUZ_34225 [Streptomyces sp. NPDC058646]|uniref:hypothetical protein n=1 Tax=Streptomyces sp. NPDC058646 TaxID=3346574 RepID=UPI00364EB388